MLPNHGAVQVMSRLMSQTHQGDLFQGCEGPVDDATIALEG